MQGACSCGIERAGAFAQKILRHTSADSPKIGIIEASALSAAKLAVEALGVNKFGAQW
jgi:hypothetical protein